MKTYSVFIDLEPYLEQWLLHELNEEPPIKVKRGSPESDVLEQYLKRRPKNLDEIQKASDRAGRVEIVLPFFKYKDIRSYNFLPKAGRIKLHQCIRNRFAVQMWRELYTVSNVTQRTDLTIREFMLRHGITDDRKNWSTIAKMFQRLRATASPTGFITSRKRTPHRKHHKKSASCDNPSQASSQ